MGIDADPEPPRGNLQGPSQTSPLTKGRAEGGKRSIVSGGPTVNSTKDRRRSGQTEADPPQRRCCNHTRSGDGRVTVWKQHFLVPQRATARDSTRNLCVNEGYSWSGKCGCLMEGG